MAVISPKQNGVVTLPDALEHTLEFGNVVGAGPGQDCLALIDFDDANSTNGIQFAVGEAIDAGHASRIGGKSLQLPFKNGLQTIRVKGASGLKFQIVVVPLAYI